VPAFLTVTGMAVEQQAVRLHDAVDPLHVDRRAALFTALTSDQRMNTAVAVSGLAGDQRLDFAHKRCLGLWMTASPLSGPSRRGLHREIGACHAERIGDPLHGVPSRADEGERNSRFFGCTTSSASRRISFSRVFLPSSRCSSRT
jgi:hypothetical protein